MSNLFERSLFEVGGENFWLTCDLYTNFAVTEFSGKKFPFALISHWLSSSLNILSSVLQPFRVFFQQLGIDYMTPYHF